MWSPSLRLAPSPTLSPTSTGLSPSRGPGPRKVMGAWSRTSRWSERAPASLHGGCKCCFSFRREDLAQGQCRPGGFSGSPFCPRSGPFPWPHSGLRAEQRSLRLGPAPQSSVESRPWNPGMHEVRASLSSLQSREWEVVRWGSMALWIRGGILPAAWSPQAGGSSATDVMNLRQSISLFCISI